MTHILLKLTLKPDLESEEVSAAVDAGCRNFAGILERPVQTFSVENDANLFELLYDSDWTEAFDKFGFGDGDGPNFTSLVALEIEELGYTVETDNWGLHNYMIHSIRDDDGKDVISEEADLGYGDPREYLPQEIVSALDAAFARGGCHE